MSKAIVLANVRRKIQLLVESKIQEISTEKKYDSLLPGDILEVDTSQVPISITKAYKRDNLIKRSNQHKTKEIVCNLAALCLVTAPPPLFNPQAIDRVLTLAAEQEIPAYLIFNKSDLNLADIKSEIAYYRNITSKVLLTSALNSNGLAELQALIKKYQGKNIAMSGVSGVGKSSLLSLLLNQQITTSEVSEKTGQGRQTTSRTQGYYYPPADTVLFDVPGIQNFGLAHLDTEFLATYFPDIHQMSCPYRGCQHIGEAECAIKAAVLAGDILKSRHDSYISIYQEIKKAEEYQWNN